MSTSFSPPIADQCSSYLSISVSPSAGHCEARTLPQPFLFCSSNMDTASLSLYRGPTPTFLPYLTPFHHHAHFSVYECPFEPAFIQKRNERERQRVKCVNQGYAKLRDHLPGHLPRHLPGHSADKRLSKVETLRAAISYIKYLQQLVDLEDESRNTESNRTTV
ncbi:achaete-scute homolog 5-like [Solea solea]|uniref:achaete-scute homolog 5-like n=1 Tax=Solea solea TaxID=90069 RepID=UPI00272A2264|nr:achaete-scute homolog 5-like [Solea solea]